VAGYVVQVKVVLLDVLAVVALVAAKPEHPFLENRIGAVPQREREAKQLAVVADAGNAVLAPGIGARARAVVRKIFSSGAVGAVILAHGSPLPFA